MNEGSRDIILLKEILEYLKESLADMVIPEQPTDDAGRRLYRVLDLQMMKKDTMLRCIDLNKLIDGAHHQLLTLQQMTEMINTKQVLLILLRLTSYIIYV